MSNHIRVIGFSGKMGSGKSTAALLAQQHLARITGEPWTVVAFADSLKALYSRIGQVPLSFCYTDVGKAIIPVETPRGLTCEDVDAFYPLDNHSINRVNEVIANEAAAVANGKVHTVGRWLQILGQALRDIEPDYWVRVFEACMEVGVNYIIEDVRYPNEFEWIRDVQMGIVGRVTSDRTSLCNTGREVQHRSETALDACTAWHFEIDNGGQHSEGKLMSALAEKLDPFFVSK